MFGLYVLFKGVFFLLLRPLPWSWSWLLALPGKPSEALNHCSFSLLGMRSSVMALPRTVFASWMVPLYMKSRKNSFTNNKALCTAVQHLRLEADCQWQPSWHGSGVYQVDFDSPMALFQEGSLITSQLIYHLS